MEQAESVGAVAEGRQAVHDARQVPPPGAPQDQDSPGERPSGSRRDAGETQQRPTQEAGDRDGWKRGRQWTTLASSVSPSTAAPRNSN